MIFIAVVIGIILSLFGLWRITAIKLNNTQEQLNQVSSQLVTLQKDNDNLIAYNKKKEAEIKKLNKEYEEKLNQIPADVCGDTVPSKELLQYLKGNENE